MSVFRCRQCDVEVESEDLMQHVDTHRLPQTMTQVWESFQLVKVTGQGSRPRRSESEYGAGTLPLF